MLWYLYLAASIIGIAIHLAMDRRPRTAARVVEIVLLYLLVIFVGVGGILGAFAHIFMADQTALSIGWQPGSPFQFEVAMANLAFGVLGILCIWKRGGFWTATGIGIAVFYLGAAYGHIRDMIVNGNYAPDNAGPVLWLNDIAVPIVILALLYVRSRLSSTAR